MTTNNPTPSTTHKSTSVAEILAKYQHSGIQDIANETPATISAEIVILSAKLWEASSITFKAEAAMAKKWATLRSENCETDGQADKMIKTTDEYLELQQAKTNEKVVIEMIRSLKKLLQAKGDEMRNLC